EIKSLSHKDKDDLQNELWEIIKANDLSKLKQFLQYYDAQRFFYDPNFDDEEEPIFNAAITLRNACLVCDRTKDFQILEFLLQYGLKANDNDGWGNALQYYVDVGGQDSQIISFLLEREAEFEDYGRDGWNFLHRCAANQEIEKIQIACKYGANIDTRTQVQIGKHKISQTPLMILLLSNSSPKIQAIKALIALGADVNAVDNQKSVLDMALNQKEKESLKQAGAKSYKELCAL
ncbi:ankyrin repeat domain-containing protein, partial [Helicobacter ganmani]|uniref:ankyrin repeat domain-containing protein n=2 Tax=Helicobacteraceae TaxID=72293 RepID=UPI003A842FEB